MKLAVWPFEFIKNGNKKFEIRLLDEKRQAIKIGDEIEFTLADDSSQTIRVYVKELITAPTFVELFGRVDPEFAGWPTGTSPQQAADDMRKFYAEDEEKEFGTVAIGLEVSEISPLRSSDSLRSK